MKPSITTEVIEALRVLRMHVKFYADISSEFDVLDNAGIFSAIDDATGYDVDPSPDAKPQVSRCTCPSWAKQYGHRAGCPGDPAEWGDMAFTMAPKRRECTADDCTGEFAVNQDGALRAHANDMCEPCSQGR